jgi:hypothetical protein
MQSLILDMPKEAGAQLNYLAVLASCENYHIPTCPNVSVQELISNKIYNWYANMLHSQDQQQVSYFMNYE